MMKSKYMLFPTLLSALLLLSACSEGDSGSTSAPAPAPTAAAPSDSSDSGSSSGSMEKAEGVVYQDEIYANWPYN